MTYKSASQLSVFELCQRKWGWLYLEGIRPPPHPSAVRGQEIHAILERWFRDGVAPDVTTPHGRIAAAGIPLLPQPGPHLEVEREFWLELGQHTYRGFVDLGLVEGRDPDCPGCIGAAFECPEHGSGLPWVIDHKTTGDFRWALSPDPNDDRYLGHNLQALLYAREALHRYPAAEQVQLLWPYYRTRGKPEVLPVHVRLDRSEVLDTFPHIEQIADEIDAARKLDVLDLPPNGNACSAYGGCPFLDRCNLSAMEQVRSIMAHKAQRQSLVEKLKARNTQKEKQDAPDKPKAKPLEAVPDPKPEEAPEPKVNPPEQPSEEIARSTGPDPREPDKAPKKKKGRKKKTTKKPEPSPSPSPLPMAGTDLGSPIHPANAWLLLTLAGHDADEALARFTELSE